jgi:hypothetical protein
LVKLAVTRQVQWPTGKPVVEVSIGGIDYANPDALVAKYEGEFVEFDDSREAVEAAIRICREWRRDGRKDANVGFGSTGGFTAPFDDCTFKEARDWASRLSKKKQDSTSKEDSMKEGDIEE